MSITNGTLLVSDDPEIRDKLAVALGDDDLLTPLAQCDSVRQVTAHLGKGPSDLVIVDIRPDPDAILGALGVLVDSHPRSRFLVVAASFDERLVFEAMQAGARHFLTDSWITPDIVPICRDLVEQVRAAPSSHGVIVTVLSAGGGCGATTIAINLAAELAELNEQGSLVVDLDTRFGGVGTHLGLDGRYGIADLLDEDGPLDPELVRSTAVKHGDSIEALLSPASMDLDNPELRSVERLAGLVDEFAEVYPAVCIDSPTLSVEAIAELARVSAAVLVVHQLNVRDLTNARHLLAALARRMIDTPVYAVANRYRRVERRGPRSVPLEEARKTLEHAQEFWTISDDAISAVGAMNEAQTLIQAAPKSPARRDLARLARHLNDLLPSSDAEPEAPRAKRA